MSEIQAGQREGGLARFLAQETKEELVTRLLLTRSLLFCLLVSLWAASPAWSGGDEDTVKICGIIKRVKVQDHRWEEGADNSWLFKLYEEHGLKFERYYYIWMLFPETPEYQKLHLVVKYGEYKNMLGRPVCVQGVLYPGVTGYHKTRTMLYVKSIYLSDQ